MSTICFIFIDQLNGVVYRRDFHNINQDITFIVQNSKYDFVICSPTSFGYCNHLETWIRWLTGYITFYILKMCA